MDSKSNQTTPTTTSTNPVRQLLGALTRKRHIQHSPSTPTTGLHERGNDTSRSTGRSGLGFISALTRRQSAAPAPAWHPAVLPLTLCWFRLSGRRLGQVLRPGLRKGSGVRHQVWSIRAVAPDGGADRAAPGLCRWTGAKSCQKVGQGLGHGAVRPRELMEVQSRHLEEGCA